MKKYLNNPVLLIICSLVLVTGVVYWQSLSHDFIQFYDDVLYVTENKQVQAGLTMESLGWAFTTGYGANWHPLTWLSHMLDVELYGMNPTGHHLTNILFHIANTLLLFYVLRRMSGGIWQSAFVAALFALHPLHVESVAWVSERKDVLSTFFMMLTILAYVSYVREPKTIKYALVMLMLALGLMAKPMLVTLPFVLILLDFWPLGRLARGRSEGSGTHQNADGWGHQTEMRWRVIPQLVREKIPLFGLVVVSSIVTYLAQQRGGAMQTVESMPFPIRVGNALISYVRYIEKMVWPSGLSAFYPHPGANLQMWQAVGAGVLLFVVSLLVLRLALKRPYLFVGWFWYVGTLVPVIGLVQVGSQAMADRYTYIPLIGVFMMVAWGVPALFVKWKHVRVFGAISVTAILVLIIPVTWNQVGYWRDAITIFEHTIRVTPNSWLAHSNLGAAIGKQGKVEEAMERYKEAIRINPNYADANYNMGVALAEQGKVAEAIRYYSEAIRLRHDFIGARNNLGLLLADHGKVPEGISQFLEIIRIDPEYMEAYHNLGHILGNQGRTREAIEYYRKALKINPNLWRTHYNLAYALGKEGMIQEAIGHYRETLRLNSDFADAHFQLGAILAREGNKTEAMRLYSEALRINANHPDAHNGMGLLLVEQGKTEEAIGHYSEALRANPNHAEAQKNLANLLAGGSKVADARVYYNLGLAYDGQGRIADAISQYYMAIRLKPDYAEVHNNLGVALGKQGKFDESIKHLLEALRLKPDFADAHNNLGIVFAMQGKTSDAINQFSEAVRLNPEYASARYNLGLVLVNAGRYQEAVTQYSEALRIKPDYTEARRELERTQGLEKAGKASPEKL